MLDGPPDFQARVHKAENGMVIECHYSWDPHGHEYKRAFSVIQDPESAEEVAKAITEVWVKAALNRAK